MTRFELRTEPNAVDLWADVRLPFDPRGTAKEARNALRIALASLLPTGELAATYTAPVGGFCDLENVLIYNVGPGTFGRLAERRLSLLRRFGAPALSPSGLSVSHHHRYTTDPSAEAGWSLERQAPIIAERRFPIPGRALLPETVWHAARLSADTSAPGWVPPTSTGPLGLVIDIELPTRSTIRLASSLKALVDGVVSSFHRHDGSGDVPRLVGRLAAKLVDRAGEEEVRTLLSTGPAELGPRALVHAWRDTIKWNPADDALIVVDVRLTRGGSNSSTCRARLLDVGRVAAF